MGLNIPLLALYTLSVGSKRKREEAQAQAKAKADKKITNFVDGGVNGPRVIGEGETLKKGEYTLGFTIGNSKTINKIPEKEKPYLDLFENPTNPKGALLSRLDFQKLNKNKKYNLGPIVAQRNPANNAINFMEGYERFKKPADVKNTFQQQGKEVNGVFIAKKDGDTWTPTHARQVTKSAKENIEGKHYELGEDKTTPKEEYGFRNELGQVIVVDKGDPRVNAVRYVEIDKNNNYTKLVKWDDLKPKQKASDVSAEVKYLDENGQATTVDKAVKFEMVKTLNGKEIVTQEAKSMVELNNQSVQIFIDEDGKQTSDRKKAVKVRIDKFDSGGLLLEQGEEKDYKLEAKDENVTTEDFLITVKGDDGKVKTGMAIAKFGMTREEVYEGLGDTVDIKKIITTKDGVTTSKDFNVSGQAKAANSVTDGNTYGVINLKSSENKANGFGKKTIKITMDRRLAGYGNLMNFNRVLQQDSKLVNQINSNPSLYSQAMSNIVGEVREYFLDDFNKGDGVANFKNLPKNPSDAIRKIKSLVGNTGIAQIKNFDNIVLNAAGMLGDEAAKELMVSTPVNDGENVLVIKSKAKKLDGADLGTVMMGVNYPSDFGDVVMKILPQYVKSSDPDFIKATIAGLIKSKKDANGDMLFTKNAEGKNVRVLDDDQGLLTFVKDLDSRAVIGKKVSINGVERNATYLDAFFSVVHPYPDQAPMGNITGDVRNYVLSNFNALAANDFSEARKLITGFTDVNQNRVDRTIEQLHGGDTSNRIVLQEINGKATSAFNAIITIDAMEDTYQVNGKDIDINTQQGELIVKLSGMKEAGMKVFRFFKGEKAMDIVASSVEDINDALVDQENIYDSINSNDPAEREAKAKNKEALAEIKEIMKGNLGKGTDFMQRAGIGKPSEFVKSMPKAMRDAYSQGQLGKEVIRKLAIRQYHKYMLAYQLAAAIQGGTGGRTISDQDVQNILSALNFGFFTEPELERATLQEARKMMTSIYEYNTALKSKDTKVQYSAIKARELLFEGKKHMYLGIGNNPSVKIAGFNNGVQARRSFIEKSLRLNTKGTGGNTTESKIDKEETEQTRKLMEAIKNNK